MGGIFSAEPGAIVFSEFSPLHWSVLAVVAAAIALTVGFRRRLRESPGLRRVVPIACLAVAWALEIAYHVWTYVNDLDFWFNFVPLELCGISLWLAIALVITRSRAVFEIYYFLSVGALMALLFPAFGGYGPDHVRFWHFFFVHAFVLWLMVWFLSVEQCRLRRSAFLRLLAWATPVALLVRLVDWKFGVNYMYLQGPSATASPLDVLGSPPWYFVNLLALALVIFFIMFLVAPKDPRVKAADVGQPSEPVQSGSDNGGKTPSGVM